MEGSWPLEYIGWIDGDPGEGEWTCGPWQALGVQIADSSVSSISVEVGTGSAHLVVDAVHFDESTSAWRVELLGPESVELVAPCERKPSDGENSPGDIDEARTYHGRQHVLTASTELRTSTSTGSVHRLDALPPRDRGAAARPLGHTRFMSFLEGPWNDEVVDLRGAAVETVSFEPSEAHLAVVLTLGEHDHLGDRRRWRFDFAAVDRLYFWLDSGATAVPRGYVSAVSIDVDLYLLTGPVCTLMVQSTSVTASPVPD